MGDSRFEPHYQRVRQAGDLSTEINEMSDEEVVQALAAASTHAPSPYLANVLASEALNRLRRAHLVNEHIADGIFVVDGDGLIRSMNSASASMLGYDPHQLQGRDLSDLCVATGQVAHRCVHRIVLDERRAVHEAEDAFLHADGRVLQVSSTGAPVLNEGEIEGVVVAWRDISEAKEARRRLEESEARYRSLFENSPDLVITLDREGRVLALNPAGERMSQMPEGRVMGQSIIPFIGPEDQERARAILEEAFGGRVRQAEFEVHQPDGTVVVYDALGIPIIVGDEVVGVHGIARNITHLRRLEEGVRVSMALHELVMAGVKDHAIILLNRNRSVESWNPGAERLFGWRSTDALGRPCAELFPAGLAGKNVAEGILDEADRLGRAEVEGPARRSDGSNVYVSGTVNRVIDAAGAAHGYVAVLRDASPRRRAHVELRRALAVADAFAAARDLLDEGVARAEAGRILHANRALCALVGCAREEIVGAELASLFADGERGKLPAALAARPREWTRSRLRPKAGGLIDVEVAMWPIEAVDGAPVDGWIVYVREPPGGIRA